MTKITVSRRNFLQKSMVMSATGLLSPRILAEALPGRAQTLHAGPMPGYPASRSALLWAQTAGPGNLQAAFWPIGARQRQQLTEPVETTSSDFFTAKLLLDDLQANTIYQTEILLDGRPLSQIHTTPIRTPKLWKFRSPPPDFKILTGSCAYINDTLFDRPGKRYGGGYEIYAAMQAEASDLMLWLGDNLYFREADTESPAGMVLRYWSDRAFAPLRSFLGSTPQIAIWDDHDYGPNDSDQSFVFKETALALFQRYWPNPSFGLPGQPGIFTQQSLYDADFFLLDDRWYRDADAARPSRSKAMFGKAQMDWLKNALLDSHARFKCIAAGGQMLNDDDAYEGWNLYPEERQDFIDWLQESRIPGIIFLSGDRHISELMRRPRPRYSGKYDYPLWEITSSPLNSGPAKGDANPWRVPGTLVEQRNYCSLEFHGQGAQRHLLVRCKSSQGNTLWEHKITGQDLGYEDT